MSTTARITAEPPLPEGVSGLAWTALGATRNGTGWHIPERDGQGKQIGTSIRSDGGDKWTTRGSKRGLTMVWPPPEGAGDTPENPIVSVEGATDAAVGNDSEYYTIGRPSATGGFEYLKEICASKHLVVIGENDESGAGRLGAEKCAAALFGIAASVRIIYPPEGAKDLREWKNAPAGLTRAELSRIISRTPALTEPPSVSLAEHETPRITLVSITSFTELRRRHPKLHPAVIDGISREGETCNIISAAKIGKSWLVYDLMLSVLIGGKWLETFQCAQGRVLLIDNELHPATIAHRIPKVAEARGIDPAVLNDGLDVLSLRGLDVSLHSLRQYVRRIERGYYKLIVPDAWYRMIPPGLNENSNSDLMQLYNVLDEYAGQTNALWCPIHHSSKGNQSGKEVVDVGAGGGAQARAADTHLVLRAHEDPGHVVLEAGIRSFPPLAPLGLCWEYPLWRRAYALDVTALRGRKTGNEERQDDRDDKGLAAICEALAGGPLTLRKIRQATGFGAGRAERLVNMLHAGGKVIDSEINVRGNPALEYRLA